jgi:hypothetical protein
MEPAIIAVTLLLVLIGVIIIGWLIFLEFFSNPRVGLTQPPSNLRIPPETVTARREEEEIRLNSYGWVDKEVGLVSIPISQAMVLVAESNLPVGAPTATSVPTATPTPIDSGQSEPPAGAETPPPEPSPTPAPTVDLANVSFSNNVLPIFEQHCTECHGGGEPKEGLRLTSHAEVMAGSWNGTVIEPGDVENSYLIEQIVSGRMPKDRPKLPPAEIEIITAWVEAGAPNN